MNSALPDNVSLQVFLEGQVIFQSSGTWLYPLFDLEDYLRDHPQETAKIFISDKVVGKAAALMMIRLAVGRVHGELMSELAVDVFSKHHVPHTYDVLVPRIDCQTEAILLEIDDPEEAYQILCKRANRC